jgi:DNA-binding NtrC family response regulator
VNNPPTLLLVEDEPLIRTALADALAEGGFALLESDSAADAIGKIDATPGIAGIITDIRLGTGPSGWELARHARAVNAHIAVVYMSGDSATDWAAEGVPNSVMVQKPFANAQVITAIAALVNAADTSSTQPDSRP